MPGDISGFHNWGMLLRAADRGQALHTSCDVQDSSPEQGIIWSQTFIVPCLGKSAAQSNDLCAVLSSLTYLNITYGYQSPPMPSSTVIHNRVLHQNPNLL